MKKVIKNKKGFTLVEIIVVLVIMGILLAIAVPAVMGYVGKAEDQRDLATARVGFVGAQTVVLQERAKKSTATGAALDAELAAAITVASIKTETETDVESIFCEVKDKLVKQCSIKVTGNTEFANFTSNGTAEMAATPALKEPTPAKP